MLLGIFSNRSHQNAFIFTLLDIFHCCLAPATKPCSCLASIIPTTGSNTRSGFHTCDSLSWTALRRVDWADQIVHSCVLAAALSCGRAQRDRNRIQTNRIGGRESRPSLPKPLSQSQPAPTQTCGFEPSVLLLRNVLGLRFCVSALLGGYQWRPYSPAETTQEAEISTVNRWK